MEGRRPPAIEPYVSPALRFAMNFRALHAWTRRILLATAFTMPLDGLQSFAQTANDRGDPTAALAPDAVLRSFQIPDGYRWDLVLHEPLIRQPLMATFDDARRMWLMEYRQYPEPAGLKPQSRDAYWRIVYDKQPEPPGLGGVEGIDRVSVHEDRDGDGKYETHHVFLDNLNIATAVAPVPDGLWVLNPPYLTFYPDKDKNLSPDGPPEIHLEGFGLEDTHSVVNSLCIGPDGWLYAAQGSTVTGQVKRFGSADQPISTMGQAIWRYHPQLRKYEVFAEGGGNAFGVAFDDGGDIFSGHNGGDTRGFHYLQGGYYRKGFSKHGSLSNPYAFGYLMPMKHPPIQRFTHAMFMLDRHWNDDRSPRMFAIDPLHGKLIETELAPDGATYSTNDIRDIISSSDKWFRPVAITEGPDGGVYVCDWYDFQVAHIYAHTGQLDKERGRVYRLVRNQSNSDATPSPLATLDDAMKQLQSPIRWQRDQARRWIAAHPQRDQWQKTLTTALESRKGNIALELLWTIHACSWIPGTIPNENAAPASTLPTEQICRWINHSNPDVRRWLIRLLGDSNKLSTPIVEAVQQLASRETDVRVLCQIACTAKRLPLPTSLALITPMWTDAFPANDLFLPHLIWWAIEVHADHPIKTIAPILASPNIDRQPWVAQFLFPRLVERFARTPSVEGWDALLSILRRTASLTDSQLRLDSASKSIEAFERAFQNRSLKSVPSAVIDALAGLGVPSLPLAIRREDPAAIEEGLAILKNTKAKSEQRVALIRLGGELRIDAFLPALLEEVQRTPADGLAQQAALAALAGFDSPNVAETILKVWPGLSDESRSIAGATLARRANWTQQWLDACDKNQVDANTLPLDAQRAMRWIENESLQMAINKRYPAPSGMNLVSADQAAEKAIQQIDALTGDPYQGKKVYRVQCGRCHRLFDDGGGIGPDLTGYQRDQLKTLLRNIIAPSLEIREGYQTIVLILDDDSTATGFVESETDEQLVLKGLDGQSQTIDKSAIVSRKQQGLSIMPEKLLDGLTTQQVSDLMAYLRTTQPLND